MTIERSERRSVEFTVFELEPPPFGVCPSGSVSGLGVVAIKDIALRGLMHQFFVGRLQGMGQFFDHSPLDSRLPAAEV